MREQRVIELFVSEEEASVLEKIAVGEVPFSQRAQAILAVDAGSNLEQAASVAGLRVTQVRYWIGRFSHSRLNIFPETMIDRIVEQQHSESGAVPVERNEEQNKKSKKKLKDAKPKAKKEKPNKKKKGGKKKVDVTKPKKEKKKKKESKEKLTKKGKKGKKQKKKK